MRELGRGGTLVAATIAALHSRAAADTKHRALRKRVSPLESRNNNRPKPERLPKTEQDYDAERRRRAESSGRGVDGGGGERPCSTASEASERDSASVQSSEEPSERDAQQHASGDSDSPDEDTLKCNVWSENTHGLGGGDAPISQSDSTSSSDDDSGEEDGGHFASTPRSLDAEYRTLTPSARLDTSTRCDADFRWLRSGDTPPDTERVSSERQRVRERSDEFGSGSLDRRRRRNADRGERDRKTRSSLSAKPPQHPTSAGVPPRRGRAGAAEAPRRSDEAPHELQRRWNSYEHFRWPEGGGGGGGSGGGWWPVCWCHAPPPCCARDHPPAAAPWMPYPTHLSVGGSSSHAPCKNEAEERVRRLESDKESLQLQEQVLAEQVAAQAHTIAELERALTDARLRLDRAEDSLQKEVLARSSLETQKLELLSKLSEARLRAAERGLLERSPPPAHTAHPAHPPPPRTPPANYGRQIERNTHAYSSLPRATQAPDARAVAFGKQHNMVVARGRGHSVPNLAEKEEVIPPRGSPSPSLRGAAAAAAAGPGAAGSPWARLTRAGSGGAAAAGGAWLEGGELTRGGVRATAMPRLQRDHQVYPWQTISVKDWDAETTCSWLESLSLEVYAGAARAWLGASPDVRGLIASASAHTIEKELALKHPMHRKKIVLALLDLQEGGETDPALSAAGKLDTAWVLRWMEDAGLAGARDAAAEVALDGRTLHRLTHDELHHHLRVHTLLHALSVRRGIQVLRENNFSADTMVRRGRERSAGEVEAETAAAGAAGAPGGGDAGEVEAAELARWSSHRVMQWLKEIDLAEYAPNLRGAGVHGGLLLYEPRFTAELLATLLNIPTSKTLLRRHLTQRFNDLLGREVIQQKRNAEQTLGYQPLTITSKYKVCDKGDSKKKKHMILLYRKSKSVPKKSQFSLKRKKNKDELDVGELVCPLRDDCSGDARANHAPMTNSKAVVDASVASQPPDIETTVR